MGIIELVIDSAKKGAKEKDFLFVKNLLSANRFTISEIANVTEAFVISVQKSLS